MNEKTHSKNCVTVSIDKNDPKLLYDVELGITEKDFKKVQKFIKKHYDLLDRYIKDENVTAYDLYCHIDLERESNNE